MKQDTRRRSATFVFWLILAAGVGFAGFLTACGCDDGDDDDSGDDAADDDMDDDVADDDIDDDADDDADDDTDDDVDDDTTPTLPLTQPLLWGRYVCGDEHTGADAVRVANFNLHNGQEATAGEAAAGIADEGPYDLLTLQETPADYGPAIASALGMEYFIYGGQVLLSATPLVDAAGYDLVEGRSIVHATTTIDGRAYSVYGIHIGWNETGDRQARQLVDEYIAVDPFERIILAGDWNDETGSTQMNILHEVASDAWSSMGVWPSARITWPAQLFYGGEGAQLIDNTLTNKEADACAVDGRIVNFTPPLSDHKLQVSTLLFPEEPAPQPRLLDVLAGFGPDAVGLLFDRAMDDATVELSRGDEALPVEDIAILGEGMVVRARAASPLPSDAVLTVTVSAATDRDGYSLPAPVSREFVARPNLLEDGGAENGAAGWTLDGMQTASSFFEVTPLDGEAFFTGQLTRKRGWAEQAVDLAAEAESIDGGRAWLVLAGVARTGFLMEGTSNILHPYDEGEVLVELRDAEGRVMRTISSGRFDTVYWQPWRTVAEIPPGARSARVVLRVVGGLFGLLFNSASFDALHMAVETAAESHDLLGPNLLGNAEFHPGLGPWEKEGFVIPGKDRWLLGNVDVNSFGGEYWAGGAPLPQIGLRQLVDLSAWAEEIDNGALALRFGAAMRSLLGDASGRLTLTLFDEDGDSLESAQIGSIRFAEWLPYEELLAVPLGTRTAELEWRAELADFPIEAAFIDDPFLFPVRSEDR